MQNDKIPGTVFRAQQNPDLLVFIPDSYFLPGDRTSYLDFRSFDQETFAISHWPRLNAQANGIKPTTVLLPDLENLLPDQANEWEGFRKFAAALQESLDQGD